MAVICPHKQNIRKSVDTEDKKMQVVEMVAPYCAKYKEIIDQHGLMCENCSDGKNKSKFDNEVVR